MQEKRLYFKRRCDMLCFLHTMLAFSSSDVPVGNINFAVGYEIVNNNVHYKITYQYESNKKQNFKVYVSENNSLVFYYKDDIKFAAEAIIVMLISETKLAIYEAYLLSLKEEEDFSWKNVLKS